MQRCFTSQIFTLCLCFLTALSLSLGQIATGIISGTVTDASGGVLPGVTITVRNVDTGITQSVLTDDAGRYSVAQLALGSYEVQGDLGGFKTTVRQGITLTVGREAVVNIELTVGEIAEKVVVSGEAPLVETTSTALGGLVDDKKIRDLPLNGRNFAQLALLQPGVTAYNSEVSNVLVGTGLKFSVNGARPSNNNFMLDGVNMADTGGATPGSATGQTLGVEAIREFSVLTNTYSAAFGRNSGGVINIVSQSGTNAWHGSVFEFHRNSALDAKNFFDPHSSKIPHFIRNQFGFAVGGPIKKDHTFIFGNYEGLRERLGLSGVSSVPNAQARQGFLPDPATGRLRDVGLNPNVIPFLKLFPLPNGRDFGDGTAELLTSPSRPSDEDYFMVRLDHQISAKDSIFIRYNLDDGSVFTPSFLLSFGDDFKSRTHLLTIQERRVFSSTVVNSATFGFNRALQDIDTIPLTAEAKDPALSSVPGKPIGRIQVGAQSVASGPLPILGTISPILSAYNTFQYGDDLRWTRGEHNIQIGAAISRLQNNVSNRGFGVDRGLYAIAGLEQLLQGRALAFIVTPPIVILPDGTVVTTDKMRGWRQTNMGFYLQDDIKLRSNLTLNLGLRTELMTTLNEINGKQSNLESALAPAFTLGDPLFDNPGVAWQPRVGLAWDPFGDGQTAVRAGFGIFNDVFVGVNYVNAGSFTHPWGTNATVPGPPPATFPSPIALINPARIFSSVVNIGPEVKLPAKLHFNLNIQRQLMQDTTVTFAYVGSQSSHLPRTIDQNTAIPQYRADGTKFFPAGLARRNPNFDTIQTVVTDANGTYHSFQFGASRRFSHGFQFQGSYTLAKSLDDSSQVLGSEGRNAPQNASQWDNRKADRAYSNWDVRNNFTFNFTYDLPVGGGLAGMGRQVLGGWTINGILTFSSGPPLTVVTGVNRSRDLNRSTAERPDLVPGRSNNPVLGGPDRYYDATAFALPELGTYGKVGRNSVRGPGFANVDFAVNKLFPFSEERGIQFRAEIFNILNHPNFGRPAETLFTPAGTFVGSAGRIRSTVNTSRQIQFGLKIIF